MRRSVQALALALDQKLERLTVTRVSPAYISVSEAAKSLASLQDRVGEPMIQELMARIAWLAHPTILPGWGWA